MAQAMMIFSVLSTVVGTISKIKSQRSAAKAARAEGAAIQKQKQFQAAQMRRKGKMEQALAQRRAILERHRKDFAMSKAKAIAGSSGGGVLDGTVSKIIEGIDSYGEQNALSALYEGDSKAMTLEYQAKSVLYEGDQARIAGLNRASAFKARSLSTLMSGVSSLAGSASKYYDGGSALPAATGWNALHPNTSGIFK